ncbi:MAG TPA: hypothetical protein VK866_04255 [Acidimicrobiales bacterium]|nr:hypothetical protein [Acidimicrobiales bacterium]
MPPNPLHLSIRPSTVALVVGSPAVLVGLGLYGLVAGSGGAALPTVLVLSGLGLGFGAARTVPWTVRFEADGVHWSALLRHRHIHWDDVVAFERHRRKKGGPLVMRTMAGERVAIGDGPERPDEWDRLRELVERWAPGVAVADAPPSHPFHGRDPR